MAALRQFSRGRAVVPDHRLGALWKQEDIAGDHHRTLSRPHRSAIALIHDGCGPRTSHQATEVLGNLDGNLPIFDVDRLGPEDAPGGKSGARTNGDAVERDGLQRGDGNLDRQINERLEERGIDPAALQLRNHAVGNPEDVNRSPCHRISGHGQSEERARRSALDPNLGHDRAATPVTQVEWQELHGRECGA